MTPYHREIRDFLRSYGATDVRVEPGGKHPRMAYQWRGQRQDYVIAASSSDRLASTNAIADLKRRHPEGPIVPVSRPRRKLADMVPAVPFNPIPLLDVVGYQPTAPGVGPFSFSGPSKEDAAATAPPHPIDRVFLKRIVDDMNRIVDETDWRFAKHPKTGRWRVFTVVE